jgi:hypothetical protein
MQVDQSQTMPEFAGTTSQRELAARLFGIFRIQGRFFSQQAPIRITLDQLAQFMASQEPGESDWAKAIDAALSANSEVFAREEDDGIVTFVTTRQGLRPSAVEPIAERQMLARRFTTPEPKRTIPTVRRTTRQSPFITSTSDTDEAPLQWQDITPQEVRDAHSAVAEPRPAHEPRQAPVVEDPIVVAEQPPMAPAASGAMLDLTSATDEELSEAIRAALGRDIGTANWGDLWMTEDRVQRFSRGELGRIRDLLRDQDGLATDADIVSDIFNVRSGSADFDTWRFAVNYRLSRETRDFEYVGTDTVGVWVLPGQPQIGTTKRKASEIGQDYRFLLDYRTPDEGLEEGLIEHVLSFYEYTFGVLPLDANVATLMPRPGFPEQRAARITFESPQTTETVVAELRFPTGNRGGFIAGLEEFFAENLIPGAVISIERTDQPNHFLLEYFRVSGEDRKLLHLDERRGKYTFRPTTYYCATQDEFVIAEGRFPKLADAKPLEDRVRRRPEQVVAVTFERVGENIGTASEPRYSATLTDLLVAANIERPISIELLRDLLTSGTYQEFSADESSEDVYLYQPAAQ